MLVIPCSVYLYISRMGKDRGDALAAGTVILILSFLEEFLTYVDIPNREVIAEYMAIVMMVLLLILILMSIRRLRPEISRYPYPFVYLPAAILLFYPLIQGTEALTHLILMIIQGGSVLALLFLTVAHFSLFEKKWIAVITVLSFFGAYVLFWYAPMFMTIQQWMWQSLLSVGMIGASIAVPVILSETNLYKDPGNL